MSCNDVEIKKLIPLYQLDLISEDDKKKLENHVLHCQDCFDEIYELNEYFEILNKQPEEFLPAVQAKPSFFIRFLNNLFYLPKWLFRLAKVILEPRRNRIIIPAAIACLIALILLYPDKKDFSDLARLEDAKFVRFLSGKSQTKYQNQGIINLPELNRKAMSQQEITYHELKFEGRREANIIDEIYQRGMTLYENGDYANAEKSLAKYVKLNPDDAFGYFYLAASQQQLGKYKLSEKNLLKAANLSRASGKKVLLERCYWHLANGYLKQNQVDKALEYFKKILSEGYYFRKQAEEQISKINARRGK